MLLSQGEHKRFLRRWQDILPITHAETKLWERNDQSAVECWWKKWLPPPPPNLLGYFNVISWASFFASLDRSVNRACKGTQDGVSEWVLSKFNGTSTSKGSCRAKTGDNDYNVNSSRYSPSTALCESIRYQAKSEQNVRQDPIPRVRHGEAALYMRGCMIDTCTLHWDRKQNMQIKGQFECFSTFISNIEVHHTFTRLI